MANSDYNWKFCRIGGITRVRIEDGEDIKHLPELDKKLWTVLSCPVNGLEMDVKTLRLLDTDGDGRIKVDEVIKSSVWLVSLMKDPQKLTLREDFFQLSEFNTESADALALQGCAQEVLKALGKESSETITLAEVEESAKILAATCFNGDGVISEKTAGEDTSAVEAIRDIIRCYGSVVDRSGAEGIDEERIQAFFKACTDYATWKNVSDDKNIFPYGEKTAEALAVCESLKAKIDDWFIRCRLASFGLDDPTKLDASQAAIESLGAGNLSKDLDDIANYPISKVRKDALLPLSEEAINPAWQGKIAQFVALFSPGKKLSEAQWKEIQASFAAYKTWMAAKVGGEVEILSAEQLQSYQASELKERLLAYVAEDLRFAPQFQALENLAKFMRLYRDFFTFLQNYVSFSDFYQKDRWSIFQAGRLYIDQRACDLCIKVSDMAAQNKTAFLSEMFLIFCDCSHVIRKEKFTIVAAVTVGDTGDLKVGKNCIFYDRTGQSWDAIITKVIENPISISQAFWSPYRKLGAFVDNQINKVAADKNNKVVGEMTSKVGENISTPAPATKEAAKAQPFDIAKYCGIFAAIGMALGYIGSFLVSLATGFMALTWWQMPLSLLAVMLLISGPSMFLAWRKLRKRNLSPVLNANGWAINANVAINPRFGETLTSQAQLPKLDVVDPFEKKKVAAWKKVLIAFVVLLVVAAAVLYFTGWYQCLLTCFN